MLIQSPLDIGSEGMVCFVGQSGTVLLSEVVTLGNVHVIVSIESDPVVRPGHVVSSIGAALELDAIVQSSHLLGTKVSLGKQSFTTLRQLALADIDPGVLPGVSQQRTDGNVLDARVLKLISWTCGVTEDRNHQSRVLIAANQVTLEPLNQLSFYELASDGHLEVRIDVGNVISCQLSKVIHLINQK